MDRNALAHIGSNSAVLSIAGMIRRSRTPPSQRLDESPALCLQVKQLAISAYQAFWTEVICQRLNIDWIRGFSTPPQTE